MHIPRVHLLCKSQGLLHICIVYFVDLCVVVNSCGFWSSQSLARERVRSAVCVVPVSSHVLVMSCHLLKRWQICFLCGIEKCNFLLLLPHWPLTFLTTMRPGLLLCTCLQSHDMMTSCWQYHIVTTAYNYLHEEIFSPWCNTLALNELDS